MVPAITFGHLVAARGSAADDENSGAPELTTTSYAILGLLALRPWSTYELIQQVRKSLSTWWPRTERQLYEQPKILVEHGLATATTESVGRRPRTVYDITPSGREALRTWLGQPSSTYAIEWDAVLRLFFADQGTKDQLLATIRSTQEALEDDAVADYHMIHQVIEPGYDYAARAHLFAMILNLETGIYNAILEWTEWATKQVDSWSDVHGPADPVAFFKDELDAYREVLPPHRVADET
jgi:PadR family transcriptional regulator AphA